MPGHTHDVNDLVQFIFFSPSIVEFNFHFIDLFPASNFVSGINLFILHTEIFTYLYKKKTIFILRVGLIKNIWGVPAKVI